MDKNARIAIIGGGLAAPFGRHVPAAGGLPQLHDLRAQRLVWAANATPPPTRPPLRDGRDYGVKLSYYAAHDVEQFCGVTHDGPKLNRNYKTRGKVVDPS